MSERLDQRLERPVLELPRLGELVQSLSALLIALRRPVVDENTDIAWEDGETDPGRDPR